MLLNITVYRWELQTTRNIVKGMLRDWKNTSSLERSIFYICQAAHRQVELVLLTINVLQTARWKPFPSRTVSAKVDNDETWRISLFKVTLFKNQLWQAPLKYNDNYSLDVNNWKNLRVTWWTRSHPSTVGMLCCLWHAYVFSNLFLTAKLCLPCQAKTRSITSKLLANVIKFGLEPGHSKKQTRIYNSW